MPALILGMSRAQKGHEEAEVTAQSSWGQLLPLTIPTMPHPGEESQAGDTEKWSRAGHAQGQIVPVGQAMGLPYVSTNRSQKPVRGPGLPQGSELSCLAQGGDTDLCS